VTAFFDGAKVDRNKSEYFEIDRKRWFFSVGAGVRYYMGIGPIRVDLAFPLHRRKDIDSKMQFMVGLGQAF
jgi:translocation and assembly module TamA